MRCKNCKRETKTPFCSVNCLQEFGETDKGKKYIEKISLKVRKEREKKERAIKKELKIELYPQKNKGLLQDEINRLSKMIDAKWRLYASTIRSVERTSLSRFISISSSKLGSDA